MSSRSILSATDRTSSSPSPSVTPAAGVGNLCGNYCPSWRRRAVSMRACSCARVRALGPSTGASRCRGGRGVRRLGRYTCSGKCGGSRGSRRSARSWQPGGPVAPRPARGGGTRVDRSSEPRGAGGTAGATGQVTVGKPLPVVGDLRDQKIQFLARHAGQGRIRQPGGGLCSERPCLTFGGDGECRYPRRMRWRRRVKPARPCIWRAIRLVLVLMPSVGPLLYGSVSAEFTASRSRSRPRVKAWR